jgi:pilus assembly protein CpaF
VAVVERVLMMNTLGHSPEQIKILVVDDMPAMAEVLCEILGAEGYQTVTASCGEEGLEKVAAEEPNLVLLDVVMPDMNGFEVCRRIKSNPDTRFLPVILVTALSEVRHRIQGAAAGADDFITKPPDELELLTRIKSLVRVGFLHDALEASNLRLQELLEERSQQLEETTRELQKLLAEKAHSSPGLLPSRPPVSEIPAGGAPPRPQATPKGNAVASGDHQALLGFKRRLMSRLSETLEGRTDLSRTPEMISVLSDRLAMIYEASDLRLPEEARQQLLKDIVDDVLGYGPIEPLLADPTITEVMVNRPDLVYVERDGRLTKTEVRFDDEDHVSRVIQRIIRPLGRRVDRNSPMVDARLPDGSRVNAVIPPCALDSPMLTIRKFSEEKLTVEDLVRFNSLSPEMAEFLEACVRSRLNIIVSGGTGSGKTTFLNVLSSYIPEDERIVTIEDSAELRLHQEHIVRMEAKPPDVDGTGEVVIRQLFKNTLRMRPDRIVVGEVRGAEALDMLQAMNTGHDGSLTTIHANSPRDTISRVETLILMAGVDLPLKALRTQIASAVQLIVHTARLRDGSRKVTNMTEVQGMEGDMVVLLELFLFQEKGMDDGRVLGEFVPTGLWPKFRNRLEAAGCDLSPTLFVRGTPQKRNVNARRS